MKALCVVLIALLLSNCINHALSLRFDRGTPVLSFIRLFSHIEIVSNCLITHLAFETKSRF